jgi:hypothetical protein
LVNSDKVEKNGNSFLALLLVTTGVTGIILTTPLQHANAIVSEEVEQTFIKNCSLESGTAQPRLDILRCPNAKDVLLKTPGGEGITNNDLNASVNFPFFNRLATPQEEQKFLDACSLESGTAPPHLNMQCPKALDAFLNRPGAGATNTNSINSNQPTSTSTDNSLDSEITRLNNEANNLKADISSATFTPVMEK